MVSAKTIIGITLVIIGVVWAVLSDSADPDDAYDRLRRIEFLDRMYTLGVAIAGFGVGVVAAAIGARLGPQSKSMTYCPFCGLEKAPPHAICARCGKKYEY